MIDLELSKVCRESPVVLIDDGSKLIRKVNVSLGTCVDIGMIFSEGGDIDLERLLISEIRQLIGTDKSENSPIIDGHDGGNIEARPYFQVGKIIIGDHFAFLDDQRVTVAVEGRRSIVAYFSVSVIAVKLLNG